FASARDGGLGLYDIYKYRVSPEDSIVAPELFVTLIAGVVTDRAGEPLEAEIRWENLASGKELGVAISNPVTGEYTIALPAGKQYGYYATREHYWDTSDNIDLTELENYREVRVDIVLNRIRDDEGKEKVPDSLAMATVQPDTAGPRIILRNIFFEFDQHTLDAKSHSELDRLAKKLKKYPQVRIQIEGHTDDVGTAEYNRELSQKRADSVRDYLIVQNVSAERLVAVGFGETQPIVGNDTDEDRAENRRVQFVELSAVARK
ncbi:MAG: OmpA family protein, partial [bacterium]